MIADKEKFVKCSCQSEGLLVSKYDDEPIFYCSFWREGIHPVKLTWWMRIKLCWLILVKGNFYDDQVCLENETAKELADWINKTLDEEDLSGKGY